MRRRLAMLVAVTAVSGVVTMFSPTSNPAQAQVHDACVGTGNAHVHSPLFYPTLGTSPHSASFNFHLNVAGTCVPSGHQLSATGTVHGHCGLSTGSGITSLGDVFHWTSAGSVLVITGDLSGAVNATPNALAGQSCTTGASSFIVTGLVVRHSI